jgi:hypothetical protein
MSDENTPVKEYDAKHGHYKPSETAVNTAASAMPAKDKPLPFKSTVGNTNADK